MFSVLLDFLLPLWLMSARVQAVLHHFGRLTFESKQKACDYEKPHRFLQLRSDFFK